LGSLVLIDPAPTDGRAARNHSQVWGLAATYEFVFATLLLTPVNFCDAIALGDITTVQEVEKHAKTVAPE